MDPSGRSHLWGLRPGRGPHKHMVSSSVQDALATIVLSYSNRLRKEDVAALRARPALDSVTMPFRDLNVCIGIATEASDDGGVTVMLRGFVIPHLSTRCERWAAFTKAADERWTAVVPSPVGDRLRARIEDELPMW